MNYYVYRVTHVDTGEFYIGSRQCECEPDEDPYLGSFYTWKPDTSRLTKEVLESSFSNRDRAVEREAELIREVIDDDLNRNYNIPPCSFHTDGMLAVRDENGNTFLVSTDDPNYLSGKFQAVTSEANTGKKNPQYGKMWIYHEETFESKRIPKNSSIPEGWRRGRVMNKRNFLRKNYCISCGDEINGRMGQNGKSSISYCKDCKGAKRFRRLYEKLGVSMSGPWKVINRRAFEEFKRLYFGEGISTMGLLKRYGIRTPSSCKFMRFNGIPKSK